MNRNLYGWVFTFNPYTNVWSAARRDDYFLLFSGTTKDTEHLVLKSKNIKALTELIEKTNGEPKKIKTLVK